MPEAGLKIGQKGLKNTFFVKILPRHLVWLGSGLTIVFQILGVSPPPPHQTPPPTRMYGTVVILIQESNAKIKAFLKIESFIFQGVIKT